VGVLHACGERANEPRYRSLKGGKVGQGDGPDVRQLVASGAVSVWALRLGSFLLSRVLKDGVCDV
jgi:hypothetical protein